MSCREAKQESEIPDMKESKHSGQTALCAPQEVLPGLYTHSIATPNHRKKTPSPDSPSTMKARGISSALRNGTNVGNARMSCLVYSTPYSRAAISHTMQNWLQNDYMADTSTSSISGSFHFLMH